MYRIVKIMVGSRVWDGKILHHESPILHHECRSGAKRIVGTNGEGLEIRGEGFSHPQFPRRYEKWEKRVTKRDIYVQKDQFM